ncbi:MAG TPA: peroxide stress protein YaaA, partial [Prolixibacteraceae bacterium]|nr:peroxide stress protein YaaA [Prolixibacteraceae bacterium]
MLVVISPAKSLDYETKPIIEKHTQPELLEDTEKLVGRLKKMSPNQLSKLMGISKDLGEINFQRYQEWHTPFSTENAKQAVLAFNGDVYKGLDANALSEKQLELAQKKLRILSGLYGVLRPLDLMQPYRLEMGTNLKYYKSKNLYEFWDPQLTQKVKLAVDNS